MSRTRFDYCSLDVFFLQLLSLWMMWLKTHGSQAFPSWNLRNRWATKWRTPYLKPEGDTSSKAHFLVSIPQIFGGCNGRNQAPERTYQTCASNLNWAKMTVDAADFPPKTSTIQLKRLKNLPNLSGRLFVVERFLNHQQYYRVPLFFSSPSSDLHPAWPSSPMALTKSGTKVMMEQLANWTRICEGMMLAALLMISQPTPS